MPRLFLFAIGGTGVRVLKSLTFLLASGVKAINRDHSYEIVPIIIDPHMTNEDVKRTENLLYNYSKVTNTIGTDNGFFATKITTLNQLQNPNITNSRFAFKLSDVANKHFREYIGYNNLDNQNQALADILFSGKSVDSRGNTVDLLDVQMDIGFVGNPNVGSVVLNQFQDSPEFKIVAQNIQQFDRIFIVSSIFGGTGAAGFPVVLKNIRHALQAAQDGQAFLQDASIGAISVCPYFSIQTDNTSPINKTDFIPKTRSALHYYKDNITGNNSVNVMYYISDDFTGVGYPNDPGNNGQKNKAHFVELAAALSIVDFLGIDDQNLITTNGRAVNPSCKEFGILSDTDNLTFSDLDEITLNQFARNLSQLYLFNRFLKEHYESSVGKQPWSQESPVLDMSLIKNSSISTPLHGVLEDFDTWLDEMASNSRSFTPFVKNTDIDKCIRGRSTNMKRSKINRKMDFSYFDSELNRLTSKSKYNSSESKLLKLFYVVADKILKEKYGL